MRTFSVVRRKAAGVVIVCGAVSASCASMGPAHTSYTVPARANIPAEETLDMETAELHSIEEAETVDAVEEFPAPRSGTADQYYIGAGDTLMFRSFDDITLDAEVIVRYDGHISLPLIPDLRVVNLTREEATELVRDAYTEVFVDPQVSLTVNNVQSKAYYVMGAVARPAQYPYMQPISLLDAINIAGGMRIATQSGDAFVGAQGQLVKALIIRETDEGRKVGEFDLKDLEKPGPHPSQAPIYPGDVVYVPEGVNLVYVMGEARRPGVFQLSQGMTLLQLLARAGGVVEQTGRMGQVILMREVDEETTRIHLINVRRIYREGGDFLLEAGDIVYIPRTVLSQLQTFVQQFTGTISPLLSLYNQAWDTWYTDDRLERLYESDFNNTFGGDIVALQALLDDLSGFTPLVAP